MKTGPMRPQFHAFHGAMVVVYFAAIQSGVCLGSWPTKDWVSEGVEHFLWLFARTLVGCLPLLCFFGLRGLGWFRSLAGAPIISCAAVLPISWFFGVVLWLTIAWLMMPFGELEHRMPMGSTFGSMWEPWLPSVAGIFVFEHGRLVQAPLALTHEESLRALRAQLQPHFLFNTLHAIGVTARQDPATAQRMTALLGDLLRAALVDRGGKLVSISEELSLLQPYVQLQQVRFQDRLRIETDVPSRLLAAQVPDLLLQPLVENAIEHGIEQRPGAGLVRIVARTEDGKLVVEVEDDGVGPEQEGEPKDVGTGLGATIQRIRLLFAAEAWLELRRNRHGGTTVQVRLPLEFVQAVA